ncbi:MAG: GGDEF domain-containing protein, partial [Eubacterium sp.]
MLSTLTDFIAILLRNRNTLQALNQQSCRDPLTDALNRRGLNQFLDSWNGEGTFALISGDINGLKTTNDTLGHQAGDERFRPSCVCSENLPTATIYSAPEAMNFLSSSSRPTNRARKCWSA